VDTITVTTGVTEPVTIARFQAVPDRIRSGERSTLDWQVQNADSVSITTLGTVSANGQRDVTPTQTTQYRLTARNARGEVSAIATVVVEEQPLAQFLSCSAAPASIASGEVSTINWATANADSVTISGGIGSVPVNGARQVTPTETTTYTLTATNARGPVTCPVTVQVQTQTVPAPRVLGFTANPTTITAGQSSTLTWSVENADTVEISGIGNVPTSGSQSVSPTTTTTYVLTARNRTGMVQANAPITVNAPPVIPPTQQPPTITACTASPSTSAAPGNAVTISYTATNATAVSFAPAVPGATVAGPVTVNPTATTTYVITAAGAGNQTATCSVAVTVTPAPNPPIAIITEGSTLETIYRQLTLDASGSTDPAGGALTYLWEPLNTGAAVLDPGQPQTRVQLAGLAGDYLFRVTVRNAQGQTGQATITVRFKSTTLN